MKIGDVFFGDHPPMPPKCKPEWCKPDEDCVCWWELLPAQAVKGRDSWAYGDLAEQHAGLRAPVERAGSSLYQMANEGSPWIDNKDLLYGDRQEVFRRFRKSRDQMERIFGGNALSDPTKPPGEISLTAVLEKARDLTADWFADPRNSDQDYRNGLLGYVLHVQLRLSAEELDSYIARHPDVLKDVIFEGFVREIAMVERLRGNVVVDDRTPGDPKLLSEKLPLYLPLKHRIQGRERRAARMYGSQEDAPSRVPLPFFFPEEKVALSAAMENAAQSPHIEQSAFMYYNEYDAANGWPITRVVDLQESALHGKGIPQSEDRNLAGLLGLTGSEDAPQSGAQRGLDDWEPGDMPWLQFHSHYPNYISGRNGVQIGSFMAGRRSTLEPSGSLDKRDQSLGLKDYSSVATYGWLGHRENKRKSGEQRLYGQVLILLEDSARERADNQTLYPYSPPRFRLKLWLYETGTRRYDALGGWEAEAETTTSPSAFPDFGGRRK